MNGVSPRLADDNHEEPCVPLQEYFEARFTALTVAQASWEKDLERRLGELNQLRKEVVEDRGRLVTREMYDQTVREWGMWRDAVNSRLTAIETRSITWTAALGVFFVVIQIVMYFLLHR